MQENNDRKRTGCQSMAMELGRARPRIRLTIVVPSEMHTVRNEGPWHPEIDRITVPTKRTINMDEWPTSPPLTTGPSRDEELTTPPPDRFSNVLNITTLLLLTIRLRPHSEHHSTLFVPNHISSSSSTLCSRRKEKERDHALC